MLYDRVGKPRTDCAVDQSVIERQRERQYRARLDRLLAVFVGDDAWFPFDLADPEDTRFRVV